MNIIDVATRNGHSIILDTENGKFRTTIEEALIEADTLRGLYERIDAIVEKQKTRTRQQQEPVPMVLLNYNKGEWHLWRGQIIGVVAGRSYSKAITAREGGSKVQIQADTLRCLHPDDSRIPEIQERINEIMATKQILSRQEQALTNIATGLTAVHVPGTHSKEEAMDKEPDFLAALRAVQAQ